jgi:hypothetical protein
VDVDAGLEQAAAETRVILLALGTTLEPRSERHLKELYRAKDLRSYLDSSVALAGWQWFPGDRRRVPKLGDYSAQDFVDNLETIRQRWLRPNSNGVVALPQHVWLSPKGELLLSCPYEISAEEFAWCFDRALRLSGIEERPELPKDAHAPRRLLMGEVYQLDDEDELGRGLRTDELTELLDQYKRRQLTPKDETGIRRLLFTDEEQSAKYMAQELALWDLARGERNELGEILEGTIYLIGLVGTPAHLSALEQFTTHRRPSLRIQVAVAYEQLGAEGGLAAVKKALKKEKDEGVRAEWVRALGACGRGNSSVASTLTRMARKEKSERVRVNAILALGYLLPDRKVLESLEEIAATETNDYQVAAILALALGRAEESRALLAELVEKAAAERTREAAAQALAVLDGGNLISLRDSVKEISSGDVDRWRVFFWKGG